MQNFDSPISEARAIAEGKTNTITALRVVKGSGGFCLFLRLAGGQVEMYVATGRTAKDPLWFKSFEGLLAYLETRFPASIAKNFSVTLCAEEGAEWPGLGPQLRQGLSHAWDGGVMPRTSVPIMQRLRERFGDLGNRELLERMGLVGVTPNHLAVAVAGYGARSVRCAIAQALGEMPSTLWPYLSPVTRSRDDASMPREQPSLPESNPDRVAANDANA